MNDKRPSETLGFRRPLRIERGGGIRFAVMRFMGLKTVNPLRQDGLHALFQAGFDKAVQVAVEDGFGIAHFITCAQVFDA